MIYWSAMPMQDESIRVARLRDIEYEQALKKNITDRFIARLKLVAKSKKMNLIISSFGPQGYGKSWQLLFLYEKMCLFAGVKPNIDHCFWDLSDMLERIQEKREQNVSYLLDEQVHTHGYGSGSERDMLDNIEMTVRKEGLSFFFACPKHVHHNYHYYLEVWQMGASKKWDWSKPIEDQWRWTKSIVYDHKDHPIGYIITGAPSNKKFLEEYEKRKSMFIENLRERRTTGSYEYIKRLAKKLYQDEDFMNKWRSMKTKTLKKLYIGVYLKGGGLTIEQVRMLTDLLDFLVASEKFGEGDIDL